MKTIYDMALEHNKKLIAEGKNPIAYDRFVNEEFQPLISQLVSSTNMVNIDQNSLKKELAAHDIAHISGNLYGMLPQSVYQAALAYCAIKEALKLWEN